MNVYYPFTIYNIPSIQIYTDKKMSHYFKTHLPVCSSIAPTGIWSSGQNGIPNDNDLIIIHFTINDSVNDYYKNGNQQFFKYQLLIPIITNDMFICNHCILNIIGLPLKDILATQPSNRTFKTIQYTLNHYGCIVDASTNLLNLRKDITLKQSVDTNGNAIVKRNTTFFVKPQYMTHIHPHNHGWFSKQTQYQVQVAIAHCNPRHIVELGSWYGTSSRFIADQMGKDTRLTCIDKFQQLIESPYRYDRYSPGDEFYFSFPRLETCMKNINHAGVTLIKGDMYEQLNILIKHKTNIDMFFIDFEKNTKRLQKLLQSLRHHYPSCTIVGDDYIFEPVKMAVRGIPHTFTHCSYMINGPKFDYSTYPHKTLDWFLRNMKSHSLKKINNKFHQSLYLRHLIKTRQFDKIIHNAAFIKVSWNLQLPDANNSTLYHYLFCYCKDTTKRQHIIKMLAATEQVARIKNNYMLTPYDFVHSSMERFLE